MAALTGWCGWVGTAEHWQKFHHRLCPIHCCIFVFAANDERVCHVYKIR